MRPIKHILVPTDFSGCATEAIREAVGLAARFGADITLMHVYQLPVAIPSETTLLYRDDMIKSVEASLRRSLDDARRFAEGLLGASVRTNLEMGTTVGTKPLVGSPYLEIVREAEQGKYDLIVLGTHGRAGLQHLLMGSVAERVVQLASCPVLTVRAAHAREAGATAATGTATRA
jgi:nucleotide-binding universal stress UspA family protein